MHRCIGARCVERKASSLAEVTRQAVGVSGAHVIRMGRVLSRQANKYQPKNSDRSPMGLWNAAPQRRLVFVVTPALWASDS